MNLISTTDAGNSLSGTRKSGSGLTAKSDHGDKKVGFFENFRRKFTRAGNEEARSQGMIDHIDQVDLLDLAADLGCISASEQSFTFKPETNSNDKPNKECGHSNDRL